MKQTSEKHSNQSFHLLIAAAGNSARMGKDMPKQYQKINGKAVLRHTIEKFININGLKGISIIINPEHQNLYNEAVQGLDIAHKVIGSNTRKNSIYNGLNNFLKVNKDDVILIHDAARPLIHEGDITSLLSAMKNGNNVAATLATPVKETLHCDGKNIGREGLWSIQTPQAFKIGALIDAHEEFKGDNNFTDDAGIMRSCGHHVEIVPAKHPNIKITSPDDLAIIKALMTQNTESRTASGFDVHAFEKEPSNRKFIIGGIEINHPLSLTGHSDADVVLHAITDALLGSINAGDIGTHFPPSDEQWKDADSAQFLQHAYKLLLQQDGQINFIDVTIMAEEPKIGPHRIAIQNRIAEILDISPSRISIKATTTEKLGFTGRKEGIACQALATISLPMNNE